MSAFAPLPDKPYSRLFVRDMHVDMRIGVFEKEKERDQAVRINIVVDMAGWPDDLDDDITNTLSYDALVNHVFNLTRSGHIHLVETLAERIAEACLKEGGVERVMVRVEKINIYSFATPGVEIVRTRQR